MAVSPTQWVDQRATRDQVPLDFQAFGGPMSPYSAVSSSAGDPTRLAHQEVDSNPNSPSGLSTRVVSLTLMAVCLYTSLFWHPYAFTSTNCFTNTSLGTPGATSLNGGGTAHQGLPLGQHQSKLTDWSTPCHLQKREIPSQPRL